MLSVQVNLRTILKNVATIKKHLNPGTKFCAVVKSNAYGLGLKQISKLLAPHVDCFAVVTIEEGIILRRSGISQDILLLGICKNISEAIKYNLIITVENITQARSLIKEKLHPRIHLAVNTAMNRFGITSVHELRETLKILKQEQIEGVYTHLAHESGQLKQVKNALNQFQKLTRICQQTFPNILIHAGCSGVINYPPANFHMVRIGKALYGGIKETKTAITVTSEIIAIKKLKPGASVGYNGTFTATHPMVIGIVRGGYADGIPIEFSNRVSVLVGKEYCPIIGRVCMDYFFIDVRKVVNPLSKRVTIIAPYPGLTLLDRSKQADMITCDLLLGFRQ